MAEPFADELGLDKQRDELGRVSEVEHVDTYGSAVELGDRRLSLGDLLL